jgi:segregation and condensation protein B
VTDPIEHEDDPEKPPRGDTDHGAPSSAVDEVPLTERPDRMAEEHHPTDEDPTSEGIPEMDVETTVNMTGDLDATVNLTGGTVILNERDDATVASEVTRGHLKGLLEALVFASDKPIKAGDLAKSATAPAKQVRELLEELKGEYASHGMQLDEVAGGWIFRTNPAYAPFVRDLTKQRPVKLSRAQIETLAILAYRQPITRPELDDVRGVDCGPVLKLLLERDLVRILGKKDEPGRPILYGTTAQFLEFFGLKSLRDLPTLREFTELNEDSRRTVEKELGETLETVAAQHAGEVAGEGSAGESEAVEMSSDTLPPGMIDEDAETNPTNTEIPPAISTSDDLEATAAKEPDAKTGEGEIDPEEEFPDDDDDDFDDDDEDEDDEEEDDEEEDEGDPGK